MSVMVPTFELAVAITGLPALPVMLLARLGDRRGKLVADPDVASTPPIVALALPVPGVHPVVMQARVIVAVACVVAELTVLSVTRKRLSYKRLRNMGVALELP